MIFGFELFDKEDKDENISRIFIKMTNDRFKIADFFKNPFKNAEIKKLSRIDSYVVYLEHHYINPSIPLGILSIVSNYFLNVYVSTIFLALFLLTSFMFSKYGVYTGLKIGLRKAGYKGRIKLLSQRVTGERLFVSIRCI